MDAGSKLNVIATIIGILSSAAAIIYFSKAHSEKKKTYSKRSRNTPHQIYISFFSSTNVSEDRFRELWEELSDILEIPDDQLLPSDRFKVELRSPKGLLFGDQINDVMHLIDKRCANLGIDPEKIETIYDYITKFGPSE